MCRIRILEIALGIMGYRDVHKGIGGDGGSSKR